MALRFWQLAPSTRNLRDEQARLQASGSSRSLIGVLRTENPFASG